ncbi:MAG: FtsQ-type POTRA domain-containing protein [Cellvibrionaceae bacterium]|nr:FtsQ-type POTRA domain-containing protein [Cellvibrionaceae bacterium]
MFASRSVTNRRKKKNAALGQTLKSSFFNAVKISAVVLAVTALLLLSYQLNGLMQVFLNKPIADVLIKGDLQYVDRRQLSAVTKTAIERGFIKESLPDLRRQLEQLPWIDSVSLRRQWPDKLIVTVVEQQPIARWGAGGFVNYRGELIDVSAAELKKLAHLSTLSGRDSEAFDIMQQYRTMAQLIKNYDVSIVSLEKNTLGLWQFTLDNDWHIIVGRDGLIAKLKLMTALLSKNILTLNDAIDTIDMRYVNGLAVKWRAAPPEHYSAVVDTTLY